MGIHGRDGAHADFLSLPSRNLLEVPREISDEDAVFTEPLAAACGILEQVSVEKETRVAVIGDGKLGILCAQVLALASDDVLLIGKHKEKLRIARNRGIEAVLLDGVKKLVRDFDVVVEASGSKSGFETALALIRPRGKIVLKSTFHGDTKWSASQIVVDEITIVGSRCGRMAPALGLLRAKRVDVGNLISLEMSLSKGIDAMKRARRKGALKVLLSM
jgi:threonine dehydrogenase-like Zn-dependent dehydrogenase